MVGQENHHKQELLSVKILQKRNIFYFFNLQWDKGEIPNILMDYPSYVGCALSALLCLISAVMLVYLRYANFQHVLRIFLRHKIGIWRNHNKI